MYRPLFFLSFAIITLMFSTVTSVHALNLKGTCLHLVENIAGCVPYDCVHIHPSPKQREDQVRVQILGKTEEGYCHTIQTITDGSYLECKYTQPSLDAWARVVDFFFKATVMRPSQEDEATINRSFKRECSTTPMEKEEDGV